jgi:peroxiredoxin
MKRQFYLIITLVAMIANTVNAQLPNKAEDISPLLYGETIPDAKLTSPEGNSVSLNELITQKPTILLIYRGGWCPYCNKEILSLGYQILAISPDSPDNLKQTSDKDKLTYSLYSDADMQLIKAMGLAFQAPEKYAGLLSEKSGGLNEGFLPVPSVFVVDMKGKILFEYINPDYSTRLSASLLLAVLKNLKSTE